MVEVEVAAGEEGAGAEAGVREELRPVGSRYDGKNTEQAHSRYTSQYYQIVLLEICEI